MPLLPTPFPAFSRVSGYGMNPLATSADELLDPASFQPPTVPSIRELIARFQKAPRPITANGVTSSMFQRGPVDPAGTQPIGLHDPSAPGQLQEMASTPEDVFLSRYRPELGFAPTGGPLTNDQRRARAEEALQQRFAGIIPRVETNAAYLQQQIGPPGHATYNFGRSEQLPQQDADLIAQKQLEAASNGDPTNLRGRFANYLPPQEMMQGLANVDPAIVERLNQQAYAQVGSRPALSATGSIQSQPWYQDYLAAARAKGAGQDVALPAIRGLGTAEGAPMSPGDSAVAAQASRAAAYQNATNRADAREMARLARARDMSDPIMARAAIQHGTDPRVVLAERLIGNTGADMLNPLALGVAFGPEGAGQILQGVAATRQAENEAKKLDANDPTVAARQALENPAMAAALGIPSATVTAAKAMTQNQAGELGPELSQVFNDAYDNEDWSLAPGGMMQSIFGQKKAFLQHMKKKGFDANLVARWWNRAFSSAGDQQQ